MSFSRVLITGLIASLMAGCSSYFVDHRPPCKDSEVFQRDVVVLRMRLPAASYNTPSDAFREVTCHHRPVDSTDFTPVKMKWFDSETGKDSSFFASVPGAQDGQTEYYFTWQDSWENQRREPKTGTFRCGVPRESN